MSILDLSLAPSPGEVGWREPKEHMVGAPRTLETVLFAMVDDGHGGIYRHCQSATADGGAKDLDK